MHYIPSVLSFIFASCLFFFRANSQENPVPNNSFEEYTTCPDPVNGYYINNCNYWKSPTLASPDYFNSCSQSYICSVPENYYGSQQAHYGNAYAGIAFIQYVAESYPAYSEYIQVELKSKLEAGWFYQVRFFVSTSEAGFCINSMGALFTSSEIYTDSSLLIHTPPQIVSNTETFFCDTSGWQEVKGVFQANGDERYVTIGVFKEFPELQAIDHNGNPMTEKIEFLAYIDDISVTDLNSTEIPTIFTPNGDGINDVLFFPFSESMSGKKVSILNRWGNLVYEADIANFKWDGKNSNGAEYSPGTYFYRISDLNLSGPIELIR